MYDFYFHAIAFSFQHEYLGRLRLKCADHIENEKGRNFFNYSMILMDPFCFGELDLKKNIF